MEEKINNKKLPPVDMSPGGILALLWRKIIFENRLASILKLMLDKYKQKGGKKNISTIQSLFVAKQLTWKSFIFLLTEILPTKKIKFTVEIEFKSGDKSTHSVVIRPNNKITKEDEEEIKQAKRLLSD